MKEGVDRLTVMRLSTVDPTIPHGHWGGNGWGFDKVRDQIPYLLSRSCDQTLTS